MPVVDKRVETVIGAAVSTMEAAANRVEAATKRRVPKGNKRPVIPDEYDGDTEAIPARHRGPKPAKINKQHVRPRSLNLLILN